MPFQKGQSGNKNGRPKTGKAFSEILRKVIDSQQVTTFDKNGNEKNIKGMKAVATELLTIAQNTENPLSIRLQAYNLIFDRAYGKPAQSVDVTAEVQSTVTDSAGAIKNELDKLTAEERELYFELCEKINGNKEELNANDSGQR